MSFNFLLAFHLICAVIWVGGMAFALMVLRPSMAILAPSDRLALHAQVFKRFFRIVWHVMPILLLSGYIMLFTIFGGFRGVGWPVHVMHTAGLLMAVVFIWIFFVPWAAMRRAMAGNDQPAAVAALGRIRHLITVNLVIGLLTVALGTLN